MGRVLAAYKVTRFIAFRDELPKSNVAKFLAGICETDLCQVGRA